MNVAINMIAPSKRKLKYSLLIIQHILHITSYYEDFTVTPGRIHATNLHIRI